MSEEQTKQNVSLEETFEQIETIIKQLESPEVHWMILFVCIRQAWKS